MHLNFNGYKFDNYNKEQLIKLIIFLLYLNFYNRENF